MGPKTNVGLSIVAEQAVTDVVEDWRFRKATNDEFRILMKKTFYGYVDWRQSNIIIEFPKNVKFDAIFLLKNCSKVLKSCQSF